MTNPEAKRMTIKLHRAGFTSLTIARKSQCQRGRGYVVQAFDPQTHQRETFDNIHAVLERLEA